MTNMKSVYDLAIETVCPDGSRPTERQEAEINGLVEFVRIVREYEAQQRQKNDSTGWLCKCGYTSSTRRMVCKWCGSRRNS